MHKVGWTEESLLKKKRKNNKIKEPANINTEHSVKLSGFVWQPSKGASAFNNVVYSVTKVSLMLPWEVNCVLTLCA